MWFGRVLLEATVEKGTRILDMRPQADPKTLQSLKAEFHHSITRGPDIRKVIPANKHLRLEELIELARHFYHETWDKPGDNWSQRRQRAAKGLQSTVSMLKKAGFHGFGNPEDDLGIVLWASDRIRLVRVVKCLDPHSHIRLIDSENLKRMTLADLEEK